MSFAFTKPPVSESRRRLTVKIVSSSSSSWWLVAVFGKASAKVFQMSYRFCWLTDRRKANLARASRRRTRVLYICIFAFASPPPLLQMADHNADPSLLPLLLLLHNEISIVWFSNHRIISYRNHGIHWSLRRKGLQCYLLQNAVEKCTDELLQLLPSFDASREVSDMPSSPKIFV